MKFVSKQREFRLVIRPTEVILDESRRPRIMQGERVEFKGGTFFTEDKSLIDYLIHHPLYGLKFTSELGSDPVKIQKHSLIFDDGAELTGPKVVAGFPERNKPVEMIPGTLTTMDSPMKSVEPKPEAWDSVAPPKALYKEEVEALIDSKLESFLGKLESLMVRPEVVKPVAKPREIVIRKSVKVFHCPICHLPFPTGVEVGRHKKRDHAELMADRSPDPST